MSLPSELNRLKILLIDDDEWIRDSLSLFFGREGCRLIAFETAEEAIEALAEQTYDVIIADYMLPGMDGLEFFGLIKKSHPRAWKILITAYGSKEVFSESRRLGVGEVVEKPFTTNTLEECVARLEERVARLEYRESRILSLCSSDQDPLAFFILDSDLNAEQVRGIIGVMEDAYRQ